MKGNKEFNKYVEKKIMKRLGIMASFNSMEQDIDIRGEGIFGHDERDRKSAAVFLIMLLDCIEKWGAAFRLYED
jgi:hypothetical protein